MKHATFVERVWFDEAGVRGIPPRGRCPGAGLRELAQHCGHTDMLREQVLSEG